MRFQILIISGVNQYRRFEISTSITPYLDNQYNRMMR